MKALILAAGFGTRLLPFTENTPKPLFTISGRALIDIIICSLQHAGCEAIIINTHHLYQKIESFLAVQKYKIPVFTQYEPFILGTGGAIKNVADFLDNEPFFVINSDIITDMDLKEIYAFHLSHHHPVTLVLYDDPEFNTVSVDNHNFVTHFSDKKEKTCPAHKGRLTFTGIQVLNPGFLDFIPENTFYSTIDAYRKLIVKDGKIKAFIPGKHLWNDMGTPEKYREAAFESMASDTFKQLRPDYIGKKVKKKKLKGDGSDRSWYRVTTTGRLPVSTDPGTSDEPDKGAMPDLIMPDLIMPDLVIPDLILADHGIRTQNTTSEIDAFVKIGRHLHDMGIPVPMIYSYDTFSGLVFLEDLGDVNLQDMVRDIKKPEETISCYKSVISSLITLSMSGAKGFNTSWTYQSAWYSKDLIYEKECRYFVDSFLKGYAGLNLSFKDFKDEFISLADNTLKFPITGFMHRDMQSRNIMVKNNHFYFIDFQGGRMGPIQYDLASLLIDPYVELPYSMQDELLNYCIEKLSCCMEFEKNNFRSCYKYCTITRNLQILGAFGYLSRIKGKTYFEKFIPAAIKTLKHTLCTLKDTEFPNLKSIVETL